jgi:hypothetical protein
MSGIDFNDDQGTNYSQVLQFIYKVGRNIIYKTTNNKQIIWGL